MADLLELGRRGRGADRLAQAQAARQAGSWTAADAVELAAAWLLAGDRRQADLALLEADQRDPSLALVPDVWGLWPAPEPTANHQPLNALAQRYRDWRHPDAQALWQQLLPQLQADWRQALEPPLGDLLLILGHATAAPGARPLDPPLEAELVRLVADAEIAAEPAASSRYWQRMATIRPQWDLARIRAADLALARGELEASARWLADPPADALTNPWFHDVAARLAVARGDVLPALEAWAEAIRTAQAEAGAAGLVDLFEQRRREARRGPGVLQVRSLASRGDSAGALAVLERLLAEDPRWQPLHSLRDQLQSATAQPPAAAPPPAVGFDALLDRASARLQALGHPIPATAALPAADPTDLAAELAALERRLSDYEARFALA